MSSTQSIDQYRIIKKWVDWHVDRYLYFKKHSRIKVVFGRAKILPKIIIE